MDDQVRALLGLPEQEKEAPPPAATGEGANKSIDAAILGTACEAVNPVTQSARRYVANGWAVVPIAKGTKGPSAKGWNRRDRCVTTAADCERITEGLGLAHAYSGTCALDVDDLALAIPWLAERGVDLDALMHAPDAVGISSGRPGRCKLLYRLPEGVAPLPSKVLTHDAGLELRCATADGLTVQDVLPPSTHPDTGTPYAWWIGDDLVGHWSTPPTLPAELLAVWRDLLQPAAAVAARAPVGVDVETITACLDAIPPGDLPYESHSGPSWLGVGMALHHETGGQGFQLWDDWASRSPKYSTREYGLAKWESFGKREGGSLTLRSLARWANERGAGIDLDAPDASEFEDLTSSEPDPARFQFLPADQFMESRPASWIIKGLVPQAGLGVIYGESGSGKSFLVLDMALAITRGTAWRGHRVSQGSVAYVCAEGAGGFRGRLQAYKRHVAADVGGFFVLGDAPNIVERKTVDDLIAALRALGSLSVVVLDTWAQVTPGANENSGEDMGQALANCRRIHQATGALVLLVHHSGKDATRGARGWSGLKAAADVELEVIRADDQRAVRVTKQKDGQDGEALGFRLQPVLLGVDEDGDDITSCVVEHTDTGAPPRRQVAGPKGQHQKLVVRVLHELMGLDVVGGVSVPDLVDAVVQQMVPPEKGSQDKRRRNAMRALDSLVADRVLRIEGGKVAALP